MREKLVGCSRQREDACRRLELRESRARSKNRKKFSTTRVTGGEKLTKMLICDVLPLVCLLPLPFQREKVDLNS